jgi:hypothetical protein
VQTIYQRVAECFATKINSIFESEATLQAEFQQFFAKSKVEMPLGEHFKSVEAEFQKTPVGVEFSRTDYWNAIIWRVLEASWLEAGPEVKSTPTGYDKLMILKLTHPLLDYNLFTQVLLNLQGYTGMRYAVGDAQAELAGIKSNWKHPKLNPFVPKAKKIKEAKTTDEQSFNNIISRVRAVNLIAQFDGQVSFRVSPKGSTPAFADSRNLSMIGVGGDHYLRTFPNLKPFYIAWQPGTTPQIWVLKEEGFETCGAKSNGKMTVLTFLDLSYPIISKSGGEIANEVMFSRKIMYEVFRDFDITKETCIMIPRMNSVLVVTAADGEHIKKTFERLKAVYPVLELYEGARIKELSNEVEDIPQQPNAGA